MSEDTQPAADPKLEAARKILASWFGDETYRSQTNPSDDFAMLAEARRQTGAEAMAAALKEICKHYKEFLEFLGPTDLAIGRDHRAQENALEAAMVALASYEKIAG